MTLAAPSAHAHPGTIGSSAPAGYTDDGPAASATSEQLGAQGRSTLWTTILRTCAEIDQAVVSQVMGSGATTAGRTQGGSQTGRMVGAMPSNQSSAGSGASDDELDEAEVARLGELHTQVRAYLARLREDIAFESECDRIVLLLVLYVDERIMRRLSDAQRLYWPPLQREWLGASYGGDEFYRILDHLLDDARTASVLFEVFYFCLSNGFVGRYAGREDVIQGYLGRLRERIPTPEPSPESREQSSYDEATTSSFHPARYYAAAALSVIAMVVLATALSGCTP